MSRAALSSAERAQRELLPLRLSLYHACRDYPGGTTAIAAVYGRNPTTLMHKMSPTQATHSPNPDEVEEVISITRDRRIIDSVIEAYGDACWIDLREQLAEFPPEQSLAGILAAVGTTLKKQSTLTDAVARHLGDDGRIDAEELAECRLHIRRALGALLGLERALERDAEGNGNG